MNNKIKNQLFFLICFTLVFNNIPKVLQMNFIGSVLGDKLVFYPLIIGFVYTIYCEYKYKNVLVNVDKFIKYIVIYVSLIMLSSIIGLYTYPYYDLIFSGPVEQIEKLPKVLSILQSFGINIEEKTLLILWMITRVIKGLLLETIYTFGGAYMIYCWYRDNWQKGFKILSKAVIYSVIVILLYSSIEIFYLAGNKVATEILVIITPFFHMVLTDHDWWPPLLWKGQLRSIFAEPSYFGMYAAFAMPFLWYKIIRAKDKKFEYLYIVTTVLFIFCLFLTKARTAVVLFLVENLIFFILLVYYRNREIIKKGIIILLCGVISFIGANAFTLIEKKSDIDFSTEMNSYIDENLGSIASTNQRSNNARYSVMIADLKIGLENPVFGVGRDLRSAYVYDNLPEMGKDNAEINKWKEDSIEYGILRFGVPVLSKYTAQFAESGILGLIAFLFVPAFLVVKLCKNIFVKENLSNKEWIMYMTVFISLLGLLIGAIAGNINSRYCYWVLLGLGYAMCSSKLKKGCTLK